jgi:hypothetical protein
MFPWVLGDYDQSIYLDASIYIKNSAIFFKKLTAGFDMQLFKHFNRTNVNDEYNHLVQLENKGKRSFELINWPVELLNVKLHPLINKLGFTNCATAVNCLAIGLTVAVIDMFLTHRVCVDLVYNN